MNKNILVIDTTNAVFRIAAQNMKYAKGEFSAPLAIHALLLMLKKYFTSHKPDKIYFTFEGKNNWRKSYTQSSEALTYQKYKGNRVVDKTMENVIDIIIEFQALLEKATTCITLHHHLCEGDDLIAGVTQYHAAQGDNTTIISSDKDFIQLLQHKGVKLYDPLSSSFRTCDDVEFFIFEKCIRGDSGDNVISAYPRVRSTKLKEAMVNDYVKTEILNHTWNITIGGEEKTYRVGDLFEENKKLLILDSQPQYVKDAIFTHIVEQNGLDKKYDNFEMIKFLTRNNMNNVLKSVSDFIPMFNIKNVKEVNESLFIY